MKDINHNFDNKIKHALESYEAPYQPDDWLLMDAMLDAAEEAERPTLVLFPGRHIIKLLFAGALFLVLAGAGIGYYQSQSRPAAPNTASNLPPEKSGHAAAPNAGADSPKVSPSGIYTTQKTESTQVGLSNTEAQIKTAVATTGSQPAGIAPLKMQNLTLAAPPAGNTSSETGASGWVSKSGRLGSAEPPQTGNNTPLPDLYAAQTNAGTGFMPAGVSENTPLHTTPATAGSQTTATLKNAPKQLAQRVQSIKATSLSLPPSAIQLPQPKLPVIAQPPLTAAAPPPQFPAAALPRFSAGVYTAADVNMLQKNNHALAGMSSGIQGTYRFARHWSIAAGAGLSYKKMNIDIGRPLNYDQSAELTDTAFAPSYVNAYHNATLQMNMAVIALTVQYHLLPDKKISPFAGIGYSVCLPYKNMLTYKSLLSSAYASDITSPQSVLATMPFTPNPRPASGNNNPDHDPLVDNPNIYDIEEETVFNNNPLNNYWVNSQPVYEADLTANTVNQQQITEANRPLFDVLHLELGIDYQVSKHLRLSGVTRLSGTVMPHRFINQPQISQVNTQQRLFTGSVQIGLSWLFK